MLVSGYNNIIVLPNCTMLYYVFSGPLSLRAYVPEIKFNNNMLKEPGERLREAGPMLKEPGVRFTETGVRLSVGVELSDPDVKKVVCNVLVVEEVKEYQDKLIANGSDLYRLETDVAWMIGWGLMVEDSCGLMVEDNCGLMVDKEVRLGRDDRVRSARLRLKKTEFERPIT